MNSLLHIHPGDNVKVALRALVGGEVVEGLVVTEEVPQGHKVAVREIGVGEPVVKFGYPIGVASVPIVAGAYVHTHNVRSALSERLEALRYE